MTIRFGTDGWRAVISDTFTFANLQLSVFDDDHLLHNTYQHLDWSYLLRQ